MKAGVCPFTKMRCHKRMKISGTKPTGVCVVTNGSKDEPVVVCPNRLYGERYDILRKIAEEEFGIVRFILSGARANEQYNSGSGPSVIAIPEFSIGGGRLDWLLLFVDEHGNQGDFVVVEVQSMDTTGNYDTTWADIQRYHEDSGDIIKHIRPTKHGINWKNVVKRLSTQIIEKGNSVRKETTCRAFYFVLPDNVYTRFEKDVPNLVESKSSGFRVVVATLSLVSGDITRDRTLTYSHEDVVAAFSENDPSKIDFRSSIASKIEDIIRPPAGGSQYFSFSKD